MIQSAINKTVASAAHMAVEQRQAAAQETIASQRAQLHQARLGLIERQQQALQRIQEKQDAMARQRVTFRDLLWRQKFNGSEFGKLPVAEQKAIESAFTPEQKRQMLAENRRRMNYEARQKGLTEHGKL